MLHVPRAGARSAHPDAASTQLQAPRRRVRSRPPRRTRAAVLAVLVAASLLAGVAPARAWKPYTHVFTGNSAWADAVDDGKVTIAGRSYAVPPRLLAALSTKKAQYNAGVVGPDGFPDLIMGQSVIHPKDTGKWLDHVLDSAWDAQGSASYTDDQQLEILAFAYGFLTHAAGDMWAHTLVNDFAEGTFPGPSEILGDPERAANAIRHVIVEGYIVDATAGYDGNPERGPAPGQNEDGDPDVSDDATAAIDYAAPPDQFLYDVFIARAADANGLLVNAMPGQPTAERGALIDFFYDLRNDLAVEAGSKSNVQEALDSLTSLQAAMAEVEEECSFPPDPIECPIALAVLNFETFEAFAEAAANLLEDAVKAVIDAYLAAWVEDIDHGLVHWGQVGLAMTKGLFDPQTHRNEENEACGEVGSGEADTLRAECEDGFGVFSSLFESLGPLLTTSEPHLLSMLGAPDALGTALESIDELLDAVDALIDFPNPLDAAKAELEKMMHDKVDAAIKDVFGVSPDTFAELMKNPASFLDPVHPPLGLPAPLDVLDQEGALFPAGAHERLDAIMGFSEQGLADGHHHLDTRRLDDDVVAEVSEFVPLENTITTAKLLLLDGPELNDALGDIAGRDIATYGPGENVMVDALDEDLADGTTPPPWLLSIDSDHAWRADGEPRFPGRDPSLNGGKGTFPLWASCVLRPSFKELFHDWENGEANFPDHGDTVKADPVNDPEPPTPQLSMTGAAYDAGDRDFVGGNNLFTMAAIDTPAGKGFPAEQLDLEYRVSSEVDPEARGPFVAAEQGSTFSVSGPDGRYFIEIRAADPCHTFADEDGAVPGDPLPPSPVLEREVWLDTTPPVVTGGTPPFGLVFDTDDFSTVDYSVDDGPDGSGVASSSATLDGVDVLPGVVVTADGAVLDMYHLYPGTRTAVVAGTDNIGNSASTSLTFEVHATVESLLNNLDRSRTEGLVTKAVYNSLRAKLAAAAHQHGLGSHPTEHKLVEAYAEEIEGQRGKGIDAVTADRFIAYARDLVLNGG